MIHRILLVIVTSFYLQTDQNIFESSKMADSNPTMISNDTLTSKKDSNTSVNRKFYNQKDCDDSYTPIGISYYSSALISDGGYEFSVTEKGCSDSTACITITSVSTETKEKDIQPSPTYENIVIKHPIGEKVYAHIRNKTGLEINRLQLLNNEKNYVARSLKALIL